MKFERGSEMLVEHLDLDTLEEFLSDVDRTFPVPLSEKQDLHAYAKKLHDKATLCVIMENGRILSLVGGYTDHIQNNMAYLSLVATREEAQHRGYASKLLEEFMEIARMKKVSALHFYAVETNHNAVRIYRRHGFETYHPPVEPRPDDLHLIYYFDCRNP